MDISNFNDQEKLREEVNKIYTPLSVAKKEIWKRWSDKKLRKKIEVFLGKDIPEFFKNNPKAVLVRDVISPNKEFFQFLDLSESFNLDYSLIEYSDSKFVAKNLNKYYLCKLFFHAGLGKKWGEKIDTLKIVNFNKYEGKKLKNIKTLWGDSFLNFHHDLLKEAIPDINTEIHEFSSWFNKHRKISKYYYLHYLALFLTHGILFDNFIISKGEEKFTLEKVIPSFHEIERIFGIKPLIVPIAPFDDEDALYWWCYPNSIKKIIESRLVCGSPLLYVKDTKRYGKGVFAGEDIKKGAFIKTLKGEAISFNECIKRIKKGKENQTDSLQIDIDKDLDLDEFSRTINHSCNPNAGMRKISDLFALRNIKKGEEITYDYSTTVGPNINSDLWTMKCNCGAKNCRKIIGNVMSLPVKQLNKYKKNDALQDYILVELSRIKKNNEGKIILPKYKKINLNIK